MGCKPTPLRTLLGHGQHALCRVSCSTRPAGTYVSRRMNLLSTTTAGTRFRFQAPQCNFSNYNVSPTYTPKPYLFNIYKVISSTSTRSLDNVKLTLTPTPKLNPVRSLQVLVDAECTHDGSIKVMPNLLSSAFALTQGPDRHAVPLLCPSR